MKKREINDQVLANLDTDGSPEEQEMLACVRATYPKDKPISFWDGALWALMHFGAISDRNLPIRTQMIGFTYAVAASYKEALDNGEWDAEIDI